MLTQPNSSSLWVPTEAVAFEPHHGDQRVDVVVVGAGLAGLTTAVLLARTGRQVVVLEGARVGSGTTGRTTAKVSALQGLRYRTLVKRHGSDAAARYAAAQVAGLAWMAEQAARDGVDCAWQRRTAYTYATDAASARRVEEELAAAQQADLPVERHHDVGLPFAELAVGLQDQAQFDPYPYLLAMAEEVQRTPGCSVHEGSRVTAVHGHHRPSVRTESGTVRADHVVVATLLPITDRGLFFARAEPKGSYTIVVRTREPLPDGMYLSADSPTRSLRSVTRDGQDLVLVGGNGHVVGRDHPTEPHYADLAAWAETAIGATEVVARWYAHDFVPVDHLPWVGPATPASPNVLVAGGFEKWGMTGATSAALALHDRITGIGDGISSAWAGLFDPMRLDPRSAASGLRVNLEVGAQMVAGWAKPDAAAPSGRDGRRYRSGILPSGEAGSDADRTDGSVVCTHLGGPCAWNDAERTWDCPLHGSRFQAGGDVLTGPATAPLHRRPAGNTDGSRAAS